MAIDYKNSLGRYRRYLSNIQNQPLWNASFWVSSTIVLVIVMVIFFLRPTLVIVSGLLGKVREQKVLLTRIDSKIKLLNDAQTAFSQTSDGQEVLAKVLPDDSRWREMADTIFQIATDSGAKIVNIEVGNVLVSGEKIEQLNEAKSTEDPKNKLLPGGEKVVFTMSVDGEYSQLKDSLTKLESVGRMLIINSAKINKGKDGTLNLYVEGYGVFFNYKKVQQ